MSFPRLGYKRTVTSVWLAVPRFHCPRALDLGESGCHVVSSPVERPRWQEMNVSSHQEPETCQKSCGQTWKWVLCDLWTGHVSAALPPVMP